MQKQCHTDAPTSKCEQHLNQTPPINIVSYKMLFLIHRFLFGAFPPKMLLHPKMRSAPVSYTPLGVTFRRNLCHMLGHARQLAGTRH